VPTDCVLADSWASNEQTRKSMQANRSRDTGPELAVRQLLHMRGMRYRGDMRPDSSIRRKADIVFTRIKVAVFIDGCFWHGCPEHGTMPGRNSEWWRWKIARNQARDRDTDEKLNALGWTVIHIWEHEDSDDAAGLVAHAVTAATKDHQRSSEARAE